MSIEKALNQLALNLGVKNEDLKKLINFESGFNPLAKNPFSGARGLIQFTDSTARKLGFNSANDLVSQYNTTETQLLGPVQKYLSQFKPFSFPYPQSLYMAVFYPAYRYSPSNTPFDASIRAVNPNINTVNDYIQLVEKNFGNFNFSKIKSWSSLWYFAPILTASLVIFLPKKEGGFKWMIRKKI